MPSGLPVRSLISRRCLSSVPKIILGTWTENELPEVVTESEEVDIAPLSDDDAGSLSTPLDGVLGEWSMFHGTFGFYVQGVGTTTPVLPHG